MTQINNLDIYTDGGSRGNPGPAAIGVHATLRGSPPKGLNPSCSSPLFQLSEYIGHTTNNVAEWQAVIKALEHLVTNKINPIEINFYLDSELVVKQIKGEYKVKQPHLQTLSISVRQLLQQLNSSKISFHHVPREQNKIADSLVNQALDKISK
jgi:ribonuclease HI